MCENEQMGRFKRAVKLSEMALKQNQNTNVFVSHVV